MPTVTVEAEVELSDIDNPEFISELSFRLKHKKFDRDELREIGMLITGFDFGVTMMDLMLAETLDEAKNKYSMVEIIERLK